MKEEREGGGREKKKEEEEMKRQMEASVRVNHGLCVNRYFFFPLNLFGLDSEGAVVSTFFMWS